MKYNLNSLDRKKSGTGVPVLFLHGWGTNKNTFDFLIDDIRKNYNSDVNIKAYSFSFPGFGESPEPDEAWNLDDFVELTERYINSFMGDDLDQSKLILVGHSFGGRVAARVAARHDTLQKLILIGSAGIKPKRDSTYYIKVYAFKTLRFLASIPILGSIFYRPMEAYRKLSGSEDYQNASPVMRGTLSKIVNEDQTDDFKKIKASSLLIWGVHDNATPLADGEKIETLIPESALIKIEDAGHFVYLTKSQLVGSIISEFLMETKSNTQEASND